MQIRFEFIPDHITDVLMDLIFFQAVGKNIELDPGKYSHIIISGSEETILKDDTWILSQMEFILKLDNFTSF